MVRVRVVGGPWPERIGCEGVLVPDPGDGVYPFDERHRTQVVVLLDDDPVGRRRDTEQVVTMDLTTEEAALIHACRYAAKLKQRHTNMNRNDTRRPKLGKQILDYNNILMGITRRVVAGPDHRDKP